jgi:hypothetical protein
LAWIQPQWDFTGNWLELVGGVWVPLAVVDNSILPVGDMTIMPESKEKFTVTYFNFFMGLAERVTVFDGTTVVMPTVADFSADPIKWGLAMVQAQGKDFTGNWLEFRGGFWVPFTGAVNNTIVVTRNMTIMPEAKFLYTVTYRNFRNGLHGGTGQPKVFEGDSLLLPTDFSNSVVWGLRADERATGEWLEWRGGFWIPVVINNGFTIVERNMTIRPVAVTVP